MTISALIPIIGPAVEKVLSFIPDPEQKARAEAAFAQQLMDQDQAFRDFVVAYEGRGDQVHWCVQIYRSSVRPTITYFLAGVFAYGFIHPDLISDDTMSMLFNLNLLTMGFWFGGRTLQQLGLDLGSWNKAARDGGHPR